MTSHHYCVVLILFTCLAFQFALSEDKSINNNHIDLCGTNQQLDLSAINFIHSPWSVVKQFSNVNHYIDILPCSTFSSVNYTIPENCKNSFICHKVVKDLQTKYIGYVPVSIENEFSNTVKVKYFGPHCSENINYTIDIRFACGNNLGYPSYPVYFLQNDCSIKLDWETSAACKGKNVPNLFGLNEMRCYVIDNEGKQRDLTPLIRHQGSYKVMSPDQEFYINVCTDAVDKCSENSSSACIRNQEGLLESTGSYKWSELKFHPASELNKIEYIELTYQRKNPKCKNLNNLSVTKIRFICPKSLDQSYAIQHNPILLSTLDCHYEIDWVTDYACPVTDIKSSALSCKFENLNFNTLKSSSYYEVKNVNIGNKNYSILLNICGSVKHESFPESSVSLVETDGFKFSKSLGSMKESEFIKSHNKLRLVYKTRVATCNSSLNQKFEHTIIDFECDRFAGLGKPEFVYYDDCSYFFTWKTNFVCPIFNLTCSYLSKDPWLQVDLSPLIKSNSPYVVQQHLHNPNFFYTFKTNKKIYLNVCGYLPQTDETKGCENSAACIVDKKANTSISLGYFNGPLTYNDELKVIELQYTGGYDPKTKKALSTKINFYCEPWNYDNEPYLIDYNEKEGQYIIQFKTVAACPIQQIEGNDCVVINPYLNHVFNLNPLRSASYYSVKNEDSRYEFELNVCGPIQHGSCSPETAICQKELVGQRRNFSLGHSTTSLSYWNTVINMTFSDGTPYNDKNRTPRKSHISFICDPNAGKGHPEFDGEKDQAYFFRWYTSLSCPGDLPEVTHCVFENETHFFDLSPLSLDRGNHFVLGENASIAYINFCRPLNKIRDRLLEDCKQNSGICIVKDFNSGKNKSISLGEPFGHPFMGYDGNIYLLYRNGDVCPHDKKRFLTSRVRLDCDPNIDQDLSITLVDPNQYHLEEGNDCTYEFIVRSPIACPRKFSDLSLDQCVYVDKRTNLSADFNQLTDHQTNYVIKASNGPHSAFFLNMCKSISGLSNECIDSAVCFRDADNSIFSYGNINNTKVYIEENNLHIRYTGGSVCDTTVDNRGRSADIEFICDYQARSSVPTLIYYNHCLAKFQWRTSAVCNLVVPSCSLIDSTTGHFYSLAKLSSLSHVWNVSTENGNVHYLINVCKPLPLDHNCGSSSAACKCSVHDGVTECSHSVGKVSDHELTIDSKTKYLILTYEDNEPLCEGEAFRTQIRFRCANQTGFSGPQFISMNHCTHHFIWDTIFACSNQFLTDGPIKLDLDNDYFVYDKSTGQKLDFKPILHSNHVVKEERSIDNYSYVFNFTNTNSGHSQCDGAAVCQTKPSTNFSRNIGSTNNWQFSSYGDELHLTINSNNSRCGRNTNKMMSSTIIFICSHKLGVGKPQFMFESEDCKYFFTWETEVVCQVFKDSTSSRSMADHTNAHRSSLSVGWMLFILICFTMLSVVAWMFLSTSARRDDVVFNIRKLFRRNQTPQIPFRYQQLSL